MSEHNSYGLYYSEPDYIGKIDFILVFLIIIYQLHIWWKIYVNFLFDFTADDFADGEDQLTLLPCAVCGEFYHDQVSLDKHVANDHEPFATRRPFNDKAVKFDIPNVQHAAIRSIPVPIDLILPTPPLPR